jgi:predicted helicase
MNTGEILIYQNPESSIKNDPNDWATEVGNPCYILDLLLSIVNAMPKLTFDSSQTTENQE